MGLKKAMFSAPPHKEQCALNTTDSTLPRARRRRRNFATPADIGGDMEQTSIDGRAEAKDYRAGSDESC